MKKQKVRFESFRNSVKCPKCGEKIRKAKEEHHRTFECTKQFVQCSFCDIVLPREIASDHEDYCGSKAAICTNCGDHVIVKDFNYHKKLCEVDNTALPCEFCKTLVPAHVLARHQRKCLHQDSTVDGNFMRREYYNEGLRQSANSPNKNQGSVFRTQERDNLKEATELFVEANGRIDRVEENFMHKEYYNEGRRQSAHSLNKNRGSVFRTQERDKIREAKELFVEANGRVDRVGEARAKAYRESITIVALPCEICGDLCPSDKLMDHQLECQIEREVTIENDPNYALQSSPRSFDSVFSRHDSSETSSVRYFEVRRGYSPTIEFADDDISLEGDIGFGFVSRDQRSSSNFPLSRQEGFASGGNSSTSGVSFIEYQRGYNPEMMFEEEIEPEISMHNIPTFCLTLEDSRSLERNDSSRFDHVESRFREERN